MSLLAGLSQQGEALTAHNDDAAAHGALYSAGKPFRSVKGTVEAGIASTGFIVDSDSTLMENYPVLRQFAEWLSEQYPTHTVRYSSINVGLNALYPSEIINVGSSGLRRYEAVGDCDYAAWAESINGLGMPTNWEVRFAAAPYASYRDNRIILGKTGADGDVGITFSLNSGVPTVKWSTDGTMAAFTQSAAADGAIPGYSDGTHDVLTAGASVVPLWVRIVKSGTSFSFYYSTTSGASWTKIGNDVTNANAIFASTADWTIGGASTVPTGMHTALRSPVFYVAMMDSSGNHMFPDFVEAFTLREQVGYPLNYPGFSGSPEILILNSSVGGSTIDDAYATEEKTKQFFPWVDCPLVIVGKSYNLVGLRRGAYREKLDDWKTAILSRLPSARIAVVAQPPRTGAATVYARRIAHSERVDESIAWGLGNGGGIIDTQAMYIRTPDYETDLYVSDGVHPSTAGVAVSLNAWKESWKAS